MANSSAQMLSIKRGLDIACSLFLLLALSPLLIAVAVAVKLTSEGPALYRQERIGRHGEPFHMLKFRSMVPDADTRLLALLAQQGTAAGPLMKLDHDPRVTPFGMFLRKFSIDELPQLFNVLAGDMSLVGPRPQRSIEVAQYDAVQRRRLLASPGMTGLWQVSGRSKLAWEKAVSLDLHYVDNWTLSLDLLILLRTVPAVLRPGATAF